jgi:hypothetical protein
MAEVGEAVEGRSLADLCVAGQTSGEIHPDTHRCRLNFLSPEGADVSVAFVPIVHVEGKLLVAVPFVAWHRTASRRLLPKGALSKPVPVEVSGTLVEEAAEEESIDITTKAWVGFLSAELLQAAVIGEPEEGAITAEFGEELEVRVQLSALVLVAIADEHFSFVSAQSGAASVAASPSLRSAAGGRLEERLEKLETAFQEVRGSLGGLSEVVSFVRKQKSKGGDAGAAAKKQEPNLCPGLDPAVVAAARQSGFPEDQLQKLAALARKPVRMDDVPPKKPRQRGVLSESEEDEADLEGEDQEATAEGPPIERAILQLTKVVKTLAKSKQGRAGLDGILDRAEGGAAVDAPSSSNSQGSSRSKAAAYKKLKSALKENPDWLWESVESQMAEDFTTLKSGPGLEQLPVTSRSWLEHRSRLLNFPTSIRAAWLIAGIHDCLRRNQVGEARARAALALLACDQAALDGGSWQLAQELVLELPPPYSSFQGKRAPEPSEQAWSRLADERFLELALWRLKDRDSFLESRKRLSQGYKTGKPGGGGGPGAGGSERDAPKGKREPKAKAKAKSRASPGLDAGHEEPEG